MSNSESKIQVQIVWPARLLNAPPDYRVPPGYQLRTYQKGDRTGFYKIMELAGWTGWNDERLKPWLYRILPQGWFMATSDATGEIVASSMATHDHTWIKPFCGEVGWTVAHPAHRGKGLGTAVVAAVTKRFMEAGYRTIHLYTEPWRLAALKVYLNLGYVPLVDAPSALDRWRDICEQLAFPFRPEQWEHL